MSKTVDVTIPVDAEAAKILENPARREAIGRYLSGLLKGGRASGLTDEDIDAEIEVWRAELRQASHGKQKMEVPGRYRELAPLSDRRLGRMQAERLLEMARRAGWNSE